MIYHLQDPLQEAAAPAYYLAALTRLLRPQSSESINISIQPVIVNPYKVLDAEEGFEQLIAAIDLNEAQLNLSLQDISKELVSC